MRCVGNDVWLTQICVVIKYGQPEYMWNNWPDVYEIRMNVKLIYA
jgi:hypothetical protein